ncbi:MAG TPA: glycosyltransferase [Candidatus Binataceae bacterium]|jgi:glycosyltransferase involved in cell wall biosynthesis|nr:glycosyltransferase [Candidatus Binataceae bacterium]
MIGEWMREASVRHLHVHFATPASTVGLIAARIYPIGLSLTVHGPDEFYDAPGYCLAEKIAGASFICCIGMYARSQLMKLSPPRHWSKFEVAPLGIFLGEFAPRNARRTSDRFEIVSVGRLVPAKGQHILLAAMHNLVRAGRNVCLRLVGDGPDRTALEDDARRRGLEGVVVFEGAVNPDRIRAVYESADVFELASFAEGIPVVLMEAMAMEIPCVATFITGIPELIRDGLDGLLVAPSDVAALADAIGRLMDDTEMRHRLGRAGRQRVVEHYNLEVNIPRLGEIFRRRLEAGS